MNNIIRLNYWREDKMNENTIIKELTENPANNYTKNRQKI